jgi:LPS export ABC transporter protein LptC
MRNNRWNEGTGRGVRVAATVAGALALAGCGSQLDTPVATEELQSMDADYVAFGMLTYVTANGVREARIAADTAYVYENESTAALKQMELIFYDELGKERATVTGIEGDWNQESNRMVARGDVVLFIHADSSTIESPEIFYDPDIDRVWSDSSTVRTMQDGSVQSGTAFESDMSFENLRIENMRGGTRRIF